MLPVAEPELPASHPHLIILPLIFHGYTTASPKQAAAAAGGSLLRADEMQMASIPSFKYPSVSPSAFPMSTQGSVLCEFPAMVAAISRMIPGRLDYCFHGGCGLLFVSPSLSLYLFCSHLCGYRLQFVERLLRTK